jgi:AcrR family transcriptional regulator
MGIIERKERQKESLRQEILDAARDILLTEGYAQLSMRSIAKRIEYSPTTIYLYFKNKEELLYHLCDEVFERLLDILEKAGDGETSALARLRAAMQSYIDYGLSEPDRYRIAFMVDINPYVSAENFLEEGKNGYKLFHDFQLKVEAALAEVSSPLPPGHVVQALWAHTHGIVSLLIINPDFPWANRDELINTSLDIAMKGLRP